MARSREHIDMRLDTKSGLPLVLEVNSRYWTSLLGSLNLGLNLPMLAGVAVPALPLSNRQPPEAQLLIVKSCDYSKPMVLVASCC